MRHDVRVVQTAGRLGFPFEAPFDFVPLSRLETRVETQDLDGNIAAHLRIVCAEDYAHAAAPKLL